MSRRGGRSGVSKRKINNENEPIEMNEIVIEKKSRKNEISSAKKKPKKLSDNDYIDKLKIVQFLLRDAQPSNQNSFGGEACEIPIYPGLFVQNFGYVSIPINEQSADKLAKLFSNQQELGVISIDSSKKLICIAAPPRRFFVLLLDIHR